MRGGPPYNVHDMGDFTGNTIAAGVGESILQTKIPVDTTGSSVVLKDWTVFGLEIHAALKVTTQVPPIVTVWRVPENFTLSQITGVDFFTAAKRFQDLLWCVFLAKPRTAVSTDNFGYEINESVGSKRTFGPKDTLVVLMYNPNGGASIVVSGAMFIEYFYA